MSVLLFNPRKANAITPITPGLRPFANGNAFHPNRAAYEFYPTPPEATRALLAAEPFTGSIWEPACGSGWIAKELVAKGYDTISTDLVDYGYGEPHRDFLAERESLARNIVTNPPYGRGLADAFCRHALDLTAQTGGKVAMLLAVQSLCHPTRNAFFDRYPPAAVYAVDDCTCYPYGDPKRATRSIIQQRYVWIVWNHAYSGPTLFKWLATGPYKNQTTRKSPNTSAIRLLAA